MLVQAVYPVAERLGALADTVQAAYQQYGEKDYLRKPLKASFILTLTRRAAAVAARGLVRRDLHGPASRAADPGPRQGHARRRAGRPRHAAADDLARRDGLPRALLQRHDASGCAARARTSDCAQQAAETERANLAVILARLSTGVVVARAGLRVRTANRAASMILGDDLEARVGAAARRRSAPPDSLLGQFSESARARLAAGDVEWREQFDARLGLGPPGADVRLHAAAGRGRRRRPATCSSSTTSP